MNDSRFDALRKLRERREDRVRQELEARRAQEHGPRTAACRAQAAMVKELDARQNFASQWRKAASVPSSAADQLAGRACLVRMDGQVVRATQAAAQAADALVRAVNVTAECAARLRAARAAKEKSRHSAERYHELLQQQALTREEAELDEETEVQVMARFGRLD